MRWWGDECWLRSSEVFGYTGGAAGLLHILKAPYSSPLISLSYSQILFRELVCIELALDQRKHCRHDPEEVCILLARDYTIRIALIERRLSYIVNVCSSRVVRLFDLDSWKKVDQLLF